MTRLLHRWRQEILCLCALCAIKHTKLHFSKTCQEHSKCHSPLTPPRFPLAARCSFPQPLTSAFKSDPQACCEKSFSTRELFTPLFRAHPKKKKSHLASACSLSWHYSPSRLPVASHKELRLLSWICSPLRSSSDWAGWSIRTCKNKRE